MGKERRGEKETKIPLLFKNITLRHAVKIGRRGKLRNSENWQAYQRNMTASEKLSGYVQYIIRIKSCKTEGMRHIQQQTKRGIC